MTILVNAFGILAATTVVSYFVAWGSLVNTDGRDNRLNDVCMRLSVICSLSAVVCSVSLLAGKIAGY